MARRPGLGERACPKCKETIRADALVCKHCGSEFSAEDVAAATKKAARTKKLTAIGCLAPLLLVATCAVVVGVSSGEQKPVVPEKPGATAKADALTFYGQVMTTVRECDSASSRIAAAAKRGDLVGAYQAAQQTENSCLSTNNDIAKIELPVSVGKEHYEELKKTREACEKTYLYRWSSAGEFKKVLDAPGRVSAMAELKDTLETVQIGTMACVAGLVATTMALGATEAEMKAAAES